MCASILFYPTSIYHVAWRLRLFPDNWLATRCRASSLNNLSCKQSWGPSLNATTVLGTEESMRRHCTSLPILNTTGRKREHPCVKHGRNLLRISQWTACRNFDWLVCVASGQGCQSTSCVRDFYLTQPATLVELAPRHQLIVSASDIYVMELCILDWICRRPNSLWQPSTTYFRCAIDPDAPAALVKWVNRAS